MHDKSSESRESNVFICESVYVWIYISLNSLAYPVGVCFVLRSTMIVCYVTRE